MNSLRKFVASTTLAEPLEWESSTLIKGDIAAITEVKQQDGGDLLVIGSSQLVQTLIGSDLFDEFRLMIDPLLAGGGKRLSTDEVQDRRSAAWSGTSLDGAAPWCGPAAQLALS